MVKKYESSIAHFSFQLHIQGSYEDNFIDTTIDAYETMAHPCAVSDLLAGYVFDHLTPEMMGDMRARMIDDPERYGLSITTARHMQTHGVLHWAQSYYAGSTAPKVNMIFQDEYHMPEHEMHALTHSVQLWEPYGLAPGSVVYDYSTCPDYDSNAHFLAAEELGLIDRYEHLRYMNEYAELDPRGYPTHIYDLDEPETWRYFRECEIPLQITVDSITTKSDNLLTVSYR